MGAVKSSMVSITVDGIDLEVLGDYTPAVKGRMYGPPEDCYPDEPAEFDMQEVLATFTNSAGAEIQVDLLELPPGMITGWFWEKVKRAAIASLQEGRW